MQNEDIEYISTDIDTSEADVVSGVVENKTVLKQVVIDIEEEIKKYNSLDGIDLNHKKLSTLQQATVNKEIVKVLRNVSESIKNKL